MRRSIRDFLRGSRKNDATSPEVVETRALVDRQIAEHKKANADNLARVKEQVPVMNSRYLDVMTQMTEIMKGA